MPQHVSWTGYDRGEFYNRQFGAYGAHGWIKDIQHHRSLAPSNARSMARLPKLVLPKFDRDPTHWPMFIQTFGAQVDRVCQDDTERFAVLRICLSIEIQRRLGQSLLHPGLYLIFLRELQRRYGNPRVIAAACSRTLTGLTAFCDHGFKPVSNFSASLCSTLAVLDLGGYGDEIKSSALLAQVVNKLPPQLRGQ